jgi:hypothetical protein
VLKELKMLKCIYKHNNGLGVIRTSYFAGKSEALLIMVMYGNGAVYSTVDDVCFNQQVQAKGTNLNISRKRAILVKYSIRRESAYDDSFVKA